jgi:hypothetical protein
LENPLLESSSVVRRFLDLIYRRRNYDLNEWKVWRDVVRLARRWESLEAFETLYDAILFDISNLTTGFCDGVNLFIITVGLEDENLLREIVSTYKLCECRTNWAGMDYICYGNPKVDDIGQEIPHGDLVDYPRTFNPGSWALDQYLSVPPNVIWMLLQAAGLCNSTAEIPYDSFSQLEPLSK